MYTLRGTAQQITFSSAPNALEILEASHGAPLVPVRYRPDEGPQPSGKDEYIVYYRGVSGRHYSRGARTEQVIAIVDRDSPPNAPRSSEDIARDFWERRNGTRAPRENILVSLGFDELIDLLEEARALPPKA